MFGLGAALGGEFEPYGYVVGQIMVTSAQVTAHYTNEYADLAPDATVTNRTWFSGGSGVLVDGRLGVRVALRAAVVSSAVAAVAAVGLVVRHPAAAVLGVLALAVSWAYSIPPIRLLGTGWGEVATTAVVVGAVPMIGALAQGGTVAAPLWWSMIVLAAIHMAMLLVFALPDLETDATAGKRVLAVRLGAPQTRRAVAGLYILACVLAGAGWASGGLTSRHVGGLLVAVPVAGVTVVAARREWHHVGTAAAVGTLVVAAAGLLAGTLASG